MITSPSVHVLNVEGSAWAVLREWLAGYFNGQSHTIGGHSATLFPPAVLTFQQADIPHPLNGAAITLLWVQDSMVDRDFDTINGSVQQRDIIRAHWQFYVRAQFQGQQSNRAVGHAQRVAGLLYALLSNTHATLDLARKGIHHIAARPPRLVASTDFALRLVGATVYLHVPILCRPAEQPEQPEGGNGDGGDPYPPPPDPEPPGEGREESGP